MKRVPRVAIVGGGLGGMAAALALLRKGVDVEIYEKAPELTEIGAGLNLSPNALKALRYLGVEDAAIDIGFQARDQVIRSFRSGRVIARPKRSGNVVERYGAAFLTVHRADLLDALADPVPDERVHLDAACTGVETHETGADGIHSAVRDSLFGPIEPRFTGCICWRGLVPSAALADPRYAREMTAWWGPHGHVVHYPVRRGELVNFVAHFDSDDWTDESWIHECDRAELMDTYARWNSDLLELFGASERYYKWALYDRDPLENWTRGRATLLGDSAHPMLPYLGQGACMAIEDACILSEAIARTPDDLDTALGDYERIRKPRTTRAQLGSRFRAKQNHLASPFARLRRDLRIAYNSRFGADSTPGQAAAFYEYDVAAEDGFGVGETPPLV